MLKIDTHAHILPRDWPNLAEKYGDDRFPVIVHTDDRHRIYKDGKFFREIWPNTWDPQLRVDDYAKFGVQVQVISTVPVLFSYWAKANQALELHRHLNDHTAQLCRDYPRHYAGIGTVPLQSPTLAIQEMQRCVEQLGLSGVQIGSHVENWNLDAPELFPFFEAAADLGAAILVHPWDMMGRESMPKYWLPWLVGMPAEQSRAACCLILGGVLERLPELRVCLAHGGGSFPYTIGRIEHGFRMRPDLVATDNARSPREYFDRLFFDSCVHDPQALRYLVDVAGIDRVMLGTDYPFPLGEQQPGSGIAALNLAEPDAARIYHGTALEWLSLSASRFS
ncbi:aminocarboxymuconate-semialdehyde decarboxylase [Tahibacter aquaticus]|uniref:2-amino-3-carboxymuconate-6-semialdehyde decarboxylase n=1 Tax=Tahibacter aquaticus TaxID=520092 RepID=A0A4R6YWL7_9GAMM|nr:amidohydrolase family protein [Tahibacter aquaticus]TDR43224.1 aminocarboxymuconate-semialdehyde decarboxylase [Tahibacter aquaticus]